MRTLILTLAITAAATLMPAPALSAPLPDPVHDQAAQQVPPPATQWALPGDVDLEPDGLATGGWSDVVLVAQVDAGTDGGTRPDYERWDEAPDASRVGEEVKGVVDAADALAKVESKAARALAIAALIAAALKLLLSFLRLVSPFFQQKNVPRVAALVIGLGVAIAGSLAAGMTWWEAIIVGGGGPGAILFHEITKLVQDALGRRDDGVLR